MVLKIVEQIYNHIKRNGISSAIYIFAMIFCAFSAVTGVMVYRYDAVMSNDFPRNTILVSFQDSIMIQDNKLLELVDSNEFTSIEVIVDIDLDIIYYVSYAPLRLYGAKFNSDNVPQIIVGRNISEHGEYSQPYNIQDIMFDVSDNYVGNKSYINRVGVDSVDTYIMRMVYDTQLTSNEQENQLRILESIFPEAQVAIPYEETVNSPKEISALQKFSFFMIFVSLASTLIANYFYVSKYRELFISYSVCGMGNNIFRILLLTENVFVRFLTFGIGVILTYIIQKFFKIEFYIYLTFIHYIIIFVVLLFTELIYRFVYSLLDWRKY